MPLNTLRTNHLIEAHYFDFDQTLTKDHVGPWLDKNGTKFCHEPTIAEVEENFKPGAINMLRTLLNRGDKVAILSNGTSHRIRHYLKLAFRDEPHYAEAIEVRCSEDDTYVQRGIKAKNILDLAKNKWPSIENHFFYDDRKEFLDEVINLAYNEPYFEDKLLKVIPVLPNPSYGEHIQLALNMKPIIVADRLTNLMNKFLSRGDHYSSSLPPLPTGWQINNSLIKPNFTLVLPNSLMGQEIIRPYAFLEQLQAAQRLVFSYNPSKYGHTFTIYHDQIDMDYFCEPLTLADGQAPFNNCPWIVSIVNQKKPLGPFFAPAPAPAPAPARSIEAANLAAFMRD